MVESEPNSSQATGDSRTEVLGDGFRKVTKRQWWLWSSAFLVTLLLALAVGSFAFPEMLAQAEGSFAFQLSQAVRGLVGLVLLFNVNSVYQQFQISRMQRQLAEQFDVMGKPEVRTEEVYKYAALDSLTGLYNRRSGEQRLGEEISRAQRHGRPLTVLMFDLNGLKSVNDTHGHAAGDELIKHFADRLARAIRGSDVAIRFGGDEFMVLLPECKPEEVHHILGRLHHLKLTFNGQSKEFSCSAGWTDYVKGELPEDLLKRADAALYVNKHAAKAQVESLSLVRSVANESLPLN